MHANYARFSKIIFKELTRFCWMIFQIYKFNLEILLFAMQYKE